jgi:hypothetical protein
MTRVLTDSAQTSPPTLHRGSMYCCSLATTSSTPLIVSGSRAGASPASSSLNLLLSSSHQLRFMKVEPSPPQLYLTRFLSDATSQNQLTLHTQLFTWLIACSVSGRKDFGLHQSRSLCFQDQPVSCWHLSVLSLLNWDVFCKLFEMDR